MGWHSFECTTELTTNSVGTGPNSYWPFVTNEDHFQEIEKLKLIEVLSQPIQVWVARDDYSTTKLCPIFHLWNEKIAYEQFVSQKMHEMRDLTFSGASSICTMPRVHWSLKRFQLETAPSGTHCNMPLWTEIWTMKSVFFILEFVLTETDPVCVHSPLYMPYHYEAALMKSHEMREWTPPT